MCQIVHQNTSPRRRDPLATPPSCRTGRPDVTDGGGAALPSGDADLVGAQPVVFDDSYDPRTRPWYGSAEQAEGLIWTEPYVFFSSGQPGVTAALAVRDPSGAVAAIVGVDVSLDELGYVLDGLPIDSSAEAFILAGDAVVAASSGYTVAQPDGDGVTLATHSDLGLDTDALTRARAESVPVPASEGADFTSYNSISPTCRVGISSSRPVISTSSKR